MDRLNFDQTDVEARRAALLVSISQGDWSTLHEDERDWPTREVLAEDSVLKLYDDIQLSNGTAWRVIGPAPGRHAVTCYGITDWGATMTSAQVQDVVDRAPADSSEEPMPVWTGPATEPEPEPEPPTWQPDLPALRQQAFGQIDQRSDQWFTAGFDFADVRFSLSERAQIRYTNMQIFAENLVPLTVNSLDDTAAVTFTVADELRDFCLTAMAVVTQIVNDGADQKEIVRGLQTAEELAAYTDPRPAPTDVPIEPGG